MKKLMYLASAGIGYVLGSRAGRERYEQISAQATRLWSDPLVQQTKQQATDLVKEKAPEVKRGVSDAASSAAGAAASKVRSGDADSTADSTADLPPVVALPAEDLDLSEPTRPSDSTAVAAPMSPGVAGTSTGGAHREPGPTGSSV